MRLRSLWIGAALAIACTALPACGSLHLHGTKGAIEQSLLRETPLGSSEADVLAHLAKLGVEAYFQRVNFPPSDDYPLSATGGAAYINATIGIYADAAWLFVFDTWVEAFYSFDEDERLVDIKVRKYTDAL